jgi:hypothetical protein
MIGEHCDKHSGIEQKFETICQKMELIDAKIDYQSQILKLSIDALTAKQNEHDKRIQKLEDMPGNAALKAWQWLLLALLAPGITVAVQAAFKAFAQ